MARSINKNTSLLLNGHIARLPGYPLTRRYILPCLPCYLARLYMQFYELYLRAAGKVHTVLSNALEGHYPAMVLLDRLRTSTVRKATA
jgi:hypothetical protein